MYKLNRGISPVIGIVLLLAITVSLVAMLSVIIFDITDDFSETADANVQLIQDGDEVTMTVLQNENVDELYLAQDGNELLEKDKRVDEPGETQTVTSGDGFEQGEPIQVIAIVDDERGEILQIMSTEL